MGCAIIRKFIFSPPLSQLGRRLDGPDPASHVAPKCQHAGSLMGGAAMRKFIVVSVITIALLLVTAVIILADSTGPGV
jgi:hypothetical protein